LIGKEIIEGYNINNSEILEKSLQLLEEYSQTFMDLDIKNEYHLLIKIP
jgi:hypothetical protein